MQQREKQLAMAVGGLGAIVVIWFLYDAASGAFTTRHQQVAALEKQVKDNKVVLETYRKEQKTLTELKRLSLPVDRDLARSLYANWLLQQGAAAGLTNLDVSPSGTVSLKNNFENNSFTVDARATLEAITKFLFEFYQGDHLHKIHGLLLKPNDGGKTFNVQMTVEALSIVGADPKHTLNTSVSSRLSEKDFAKYKEAIVGRDLFAAYVPPKPPKQPEKVVVKTDRRPPPPPPPPPPPFDHARHAYVTSILSSKSGPEAWLHVQTTGKKFQLHEGDSFDVGSVHGQVTHIGRNSMEYTSDGRQKTVEVGQNLREATEETSGEAP